MDKQMQYGSDYQFIPITSHASGNGVAVLPDLYTHTVQIANIHFAGDPETGNYVLIDGGTPESADEIIQAAERRFGKDSRPQAIILTHGHFDHVGSIIELIDRWNIPVYAHERELPFLTGKQAYPKPDIHVEGGILSRNSWLFPVEAIHLGGHVQALPEDHSVPFLEGYQWIHTPGHSPGHVSLFREKDRTLIAGDAFSTVKPEIMYKVMTQEQEIAGPPRYLTPDWKAAKASVEKLAALKPMIAVAGHGLPMSGALLATELDRLARDFDDIAVPDFGKFVDGEIH